MPAIPHDAKCLDGALRNELISVVHLVLTLNIGGLEKLLFDLVRCADRERYLVRVLCLSEIGALGPTFEEVGVDVENLRVHGRGILRGVLSVARRLKELNPDVLHTHNPPAHIVGAPAARLAGVPVVVHTRHGSHHIRGWKTILGHRIATCCTDGVVAVSSAAANLARVEDRIPDRKLQIIRNAVDVDRYPSLDRSPRGSCRRAIHVARLDYPTKDQRTLLRAVRLVVNAEPDFTLDIVGDGPDRDSLERLCDELSLRHNVRFQGYRHDVSELHQQADLFVLSSLTEGVSISLLEAMAAGLPIVATDVGGNPDVVVPEETGILVPPESPDALAHGILEMVRDPERAVRMGIAGRRRVEEHFDIRVATQKYEQLYRTLLNRRG